MSQFRRLLKATKVSATQLSEAMDMPIRTLTHNYNSGRIPYALVYKIHKITGTPMEEIVPPALAESWLYLFDEQTKSNLPRGVKAQKVTKAREARVENWAESAKKSVDLDDMPYGQPKKKKKVSRETVTPTTDVSTTVVPTTVVPTTPADIPKSVTPAKQPKKSIADLMKAAPPTPDDPRDLDAPDFSKVDDSLFNTSADQTAGKR